MARTLLRNAEGRLKKTNNAASDMKKILAEKINPNTINSPNAFLRGRTRVCAAGSHLFGLLLMRSRSNSALQQLFDWIPPEDRPPRTATNHAGQDLISAAAP